MSLHLYNTLTRTKEIFTPIRKDSVTLYTCGPTVYHFAHIGNLRTYIFEDILKRTLRANNYEVNHVMNITDVGHLTSDADNGEDKMEKGAKRENKSAWEIADFYTTAFKKDLTDLNIISPTTWCKATDHIAEQIALIKKLEDKGFVYKTNDGLYFDTTKLPDYGKLAGLKKQELRAGERVELGEKKNLHDFALWKFSPPEEKRQMEWPSPWGIGFPGWHIECSAMAEKFLGQPFDIHCGGIDHIPVHHTNEIAQSEAAEGKPLANYWLHGEFLLISTEKMAKSGDNFITLQTLKDKGISPLAYRFFVLQTHYRKQLTFSFEALKAAEAGLHNIHSQIAALGDAFKLNSKPDTQFCENFIEKINDDLNTPQALTILQKVLKSDLQSDDKHATLMFFDQVLGLGFDQIKRQGKLKMPVLEIPEQITSLITQRDVARAAKNWSESDRLRQEIEAAGYQLQDHEGGTTIVTKSSVTTP